MQMPRSLLRLAIVSSLMLPIGCRDQGKFSAQRAAEDVASLVELTNKDLGEVERGMPEGAKRLAPLWAQGKNPHDDLGAVRAALTKVRREVPDLNVAKSTFFAVTDERGIAIRNNLEQDAMAEKNLFAIFPDLAKAKEATTSTTGAFPETAAQNPPDRDWLFAAPIRADDRKLLGVYLTGWTYRRFAYHLQETLRHDLGERLRKDNEAGKLPIFYVAMFDRTGVYGAPKTPTVNEKALHDADLVGKTASGAHTGVLTITERDFGYAAARTPKLGADIGVVVLRSEL
ncbi:hypothetical protein [Pendulispora albinea]|uniref:Uncharacterized protein n=1 Tax=Pendulispora albinea TaxID=2741071 RepID=A0ABZ2LKE3_9BACT